ncbi:putative WRKY transcription factor 3 [Tasmannia lanceolata]|uniref:putative WRKY transcription factor 3 n=1 Tax=Tasmannia lanceolata TaxID=3420 RepID=UPI0040645181
MAENEGASKTVGPARPTIALPPRENLFMWGSEASPGPMTLVSSFFSDNDPDSDCRSFSQLLAGAMGSPVAFPTRRNTFSVENLADDSAGDRDSGDVGGVSGGGVAGAGGGGLRFKQSRPFSLAIAQSPLFTVPPGLSPASLLDSPGFFPSGQGPFRMSHQQVLAEVTAKAAQSQSHVPIRTEYPSSLSAATTASLACTTGPSVNATPLKQMPVLTSETKTTTMESQGVSHFDQRSQQPTLTVDKPADDGYNWRKYGQKQVKGSEYPRSYYKCSHPSCPVKKKVERSLDGQITEIIYKGQHNHERPQPNRRAKEGGLLPSVPSELNGNTNLAVDSEKCSIGQTGNLSRSYEIIDGPSVSRRDQESGIVTTEQLSGSSDGEEEVGDADVRRDDGDDNEPDPKRRNINLQVNESTSSHKTVTEPRIIVQTTSEVDLLDDGYRWRKYGQKVVKGNPHPRSYYKCTNVGCNVRKHVERASTDPKAVITTYEGKHNHDVPAARNSSHNTANSTQSKPLGSISDKHGSVKGVEYGNNYRQPVSLVRLKEEHIT